MTKVMTQLPIGKIKSFIEENFKHIEFSKPAIDFFNNEFLGNEPESINLIELKDGSPDDVMDWLKDNFDLNMELEGDYAIATVLALSLEFEARAELDTFIADDIEYGSAFHKNAIQHSGIDANGNLIEAISIKLKNEGFELFVSKDAIDVAHFDKTDKPKQSFQKTTKVKLELPLAKFTEEIDMSETFKNSTMINKSNNERFDISSAKTLTKLDLGLDKVEVKQAAAFCMVMASCSPIDMIPYVTITDDFYVYIQHKGNLVFASKVEKEDFLSGVALQELKELEEDTIAKNTAKESNDIFLKDNIFKKKH